MRVKTSPNPNKLIGSFNYRPEVDGLRAIAVLAVVLYHAELGVSGGYAGVDVFFVISGYLITSLIIKDIEAGKFSLGNFWERRARRIIPAAVVLVLATLVAGWFLLLPSDYEKLGQSAIAHALFSGNIFFWRNIGYFAGPAEENPLLHTWSLAVEEQFYLGFPFVLLVLFKLRPLRSRWSLLSIFTIASLASLALSTWALPRAPAATFYLLPTRAWELLMGSIIALAPHTTNTERMKSIKTMASWAGLAAILISCMTYTRETSFPGITALAPCIGAALFIWGTFKRCSDERLNLPGRILSAKPLVFVGLMSYSLYLWHWPFFAFSFYWALEPPSLAYRLGMVIAAFLCAVLSWRYIETPFRKRVLGKNRGQIFGYTCVGLGASIAFGMAIITNLGYPDRFSPVVFAFDQAKNEALHENRITKTVGLQDAIASDFPRLGDTKSANVHVIVWGDSHARSILPAIDQLARENGVAMESAWHSSTPPVLGYVPDAKFAGFSLGDDCPKYNQLILEHIQESQIPNVLLAARWSGYFNVESLTDNASPAGSFAPALLNTIRQIRATGATVYLLMEVPNHKAPVPKTLLSHEVLGTDIKTYASTPESHAENNKKMVDLLPELTLSDAKIVDVANLLLDRDEKHHLMKQNDKALYYDSHHLTRYGALLVRQSLSEIFDNVSGKQPETTQANTPEPR